MVRFVATLISGWVLLSTSCAAQKLPTRMQRYVSPDKAITAVVTSRKAPEKTDKSRIGLVSSSGNVLAKRDYFSGDGEHGFGVVKAQWTPDSQFFIYSLESSGGHQAWHSPVNFFSRKGQRILSLDSRLKDSVTNPQFAIEGPDKGTVELQFSRRTVTVALSSMRVEQK